MIKRFTKAFLSLSLSVLLLSQAGALALQNRRGRQQRPTAQRKITARKDAAKERREKTFQLVWQTVKDENFDPDFGGVDWVAVRARYAPLVARVTNDDELHRLLVQMLGEIPQSHFAIIPPEEIPRLKPKKGRRGATATDEKSEKDVAAEMLADDAEEEMEGDNERATQLLNGVNIDVRVLNGQVVITRVAPNGAAARAGLRPGFVLKSVDFMPLEDMPSGADLTPEMHMRLRYTILVEYLGGEPGTDVELTYLDEENKEHETVIKRERLTGTLSPALGNLPPLYTELETKRLADKIGYIRFTVFTPQLAEKICGALKSMSDAPGLVIDLRGNPGGVMGMASGIVGLLTNKTGLIGTIRTRQGGIQIPTYPQRSSYKGPIVVLIDRLSGSTAEVLAAALQETGRAVIVGERSAGQVLGANIIKLPTGALFEYARAGFKTSRGSTLEGKGVVPDVEKLLNRQSLLKGDDDQLVEAVRQIKVKESAASKPPPPAPPPPPQPVAATKTQGLPLLAEVEVNARASKTSTPAFKSSPQADLVMERYIKAAGGREALEKIRSRISVGVSHYPMQGLTGKVTIYEQAPDKRSMTIDIPNLGVTKLVFDGERGWIQSPMMGFFEYKEPFISAVRREYDFYKITKYRELYAEIIYKGAFDSSQGRVDVLEVVAQDGSRDELHFDSKTGLLVYGSGTQYGDYRQVGDVRVPFLMTILLAGLEIKIQLEQVSHNVEISADAFAEPQSCFTAQ